MSKAIGNNGQTAVTSPIYWICRGVFIEAVRRREVFIVGMLMGLFVIGALTARFVGAETDAAAAFIMNLGISLVWSLSIILAILFGARQFPDELESRLIYPLLAKPVTRYQYIAGKWVAVTLACVSTAVVLNVIAVAASPWPDELAAGTLAQAVVLEVFAIGMTAAMAIMFSIIFPKSFAIVVTGLLVFGAIPIISLLQSQLADIVGESAARWIAAYIPAVGRLDLFNAFSSGMPPVDMINFLARIAYGSVVILFVLAVSTVLFDRKVL